MSVCAAPDAVCSSMCWVQAHEQGRQHVRVGGVDVHTTVEIIGSHIGGRDIIVNLGEILLAHPVIGLTSEGKIQNIVEWGRPRCHRLPGHEHNDKWIEPQSWRCRHCSFPAMSESSVVAPCSRWSATSRRHENSVRASRPWCIQTGRNSIWPVPVESFSFASSTPLRLMSSPASKSDVRAIDQPQFVHGLERRVFWQITERRVIQRHDAVRAAPVHDGLRKIESSCSADRKGRSCWQCSNSISRLRQPGRTYGSVAFWPVRSRPMSQNFASPTGTAAQANCVLTGTAPFVA